MVDKVRIVNRALQAFGSRTTVTAQELIDESSNEAIQANLVYESLRRQLLRMAPWNCGLKTANLVYITSTPGTPENMSPATTLWERGQPPQPWAYEYQYPVDCLRPCWVIPATQTGFAGTPITTAVTGGAPAFWTGTPLRYKVQNDQFYPVIAAAPATGGTGYAVGDIITIASGPNTSPPQGAPVQLRVETVNAGAVLTVSIVNVMLDQDPAWGGSYFAPLPNPQAQGTSTGSGLGATFNLTFGDISPQRVILTNQEFATLAYVQDCTNPNVMDPLLIDAWVQILAAYINYGLAGDKALSNSCLAKANAMIAEARKADGNEGLTVNDVTPDWIRIRGVSFTEAYSTPWSPYDFDWGPVFSGW